MSDANVKITLELVDKAAQKALSDFVSKSDQADKNLKKLNDTGKDAFSEIALHIGKASGVWEIFQGNLAANLATKAFDVMSEAAHKLFDVFIVEGVKAAIEQEKANNALNIALAETGRYSEETAKDFEKFASELQAATGVQDDVISTNAALIQSMGRLDEDGLKRATVAALNLSAALGKDLGTASEAIAKAASGNTTALKKMGLSFVEGRTKAETFENVLTSLEERFAGAAVGKVNTFAGSIDLTKAAFGDLQEEIGNVIIQNNVVIEVMKTAGKIIGELTEDVNGNGSAFKRMVGEGIIYAIDAMIGLAAVTDVVSRAITAGFRTALVSVQFFANEAGAVLSHFGIISKETSDGLHAALSESFKKLGETFTEDTGLGKATEILARLRDGAITGFNALNSGASTGSDSVKNLTGIVTELTEEQKKAREELKSWALELTKASADGETYLNALVERFALAKEEQLVAVNDYENKNAEIELAFLQQKEQAEIDYYAGQQARLQSALDQKLITENQFNKAEAALNDKRDTAIRKAEVELTKFKNDQEKQRADNLKGSLGYISSLQESSVKEFFYIGKAAALATAYIDAQAAVVKALASAPPPFNYALAAAVGIAAGVNIAKIASAQPPAFENGGIVGGSSFTGDKVAARVNSGEMILNRSQQKELFAIANGSSKGSDSISRSEFFAAIESIVNRPAQILIDGKEIINVTRAQLAAGRSFA